MTEKQAEMLKQVRETTKEASDLSMKYWKEYSNIDSFQFWLVVMTLIIPLIILLWKIDRRKMLLLGFFGLNYHIWFAYCNAGGIRRGLWEYPYEILPIMPSFSLDAALIPVSYILLYQWTLNHKKNFYLYTLILSIIFAFVMKPILVHFDFFHMFKFVNYFIIFLFYFGIAIVAKIITNVFIKLQKIDDRRA